MNNGEKIKITADDATLKWLESIFKCNADQALSALITASKKPRSKDGSCI